MSKTMQNTDDGLNCTMLIGVGYALYATAACPQLGVAIALAGIFKLAFLLSGLTFLELAAGLGLYKLFLKPQTT